MLEVQLGCWTLDKSSSNHPYSDIAIRRHERVPELPGMTWLYSFVPTTPMLLWYFSFMHHIWLSLSHPLSLPCLGFFLEQDLSLVHHIVYIWEKCRLITVTKTWTSFAMVTCELLFLNYCLPKGSLFLLGSSTLHFFWEEDICTVYTFLALENSSYYVIL